MLENKSPQILRECVNSYVGYLCNERVIACIIVERDPNENQETKAADNNVIDIITPALNATLREVPMLGLEHGPYVNMDGL